MATKKTTKTIKKIIQKPKKNIAKDKKVESPYSGLILISSIILLFIIIVPKGERTNDQVKITKEKVETVKDQEMVEFEFQKEITVSGKTYISSEEAYKALSPVPQTRRTSAETKFVESYKYE